MRQPTADLAAALARYRATHHGRLPDLVLPPGARLVDHLPGADEDMAVWVFAVRSV